MIDFLIVASFVLYAITSGFLARKKASQNLQEYFLAGRALPGWKAGTSMAATQFAADTPLLVSGLIATGGIYACWRLWVYGLAFLMMAFIFSRMWRRAQVLTDAELTEIRYSGSGVLWLRGAKAIYYGTIFNCVVMAFVLIAAVRICEVFLPWHQWLPSGIYNPIFSLISSSGLEIASGLPGGIVTVQHITANNVISILVIMSFVAIYSTTGGLRGVVNTDVMQFAVMMVGTAAYAYFVWHAAGGPSGMMEKIQSASGQEKLSHVIAFIPPETNNSSYLSSILMPFLTIIGLQWFFQINSDGTGYLAQRSMACRSNADARGAGVVFAWLQIFFRSVLWLIIGVGLLAIYPDQHQIQGQPDLPPLSTEAFVEEYAAEDYSSEYYSKSDKEMALTEEYISQREMLFVTGVNDLLPWGIRGLMLTALLAALASTIDSHLNWGASYWSNDVYKRLICETWQKREAGDRELVWVARFSNVMLVFVALAIMVNLKSIQTAWTISLVFGAGMGSVLVLRWLWERINLWSELSAIIISIVLAPLVVFFIEEDWVRMLLMAGASTTAAIVSALLVNNSDEKLKSFYEKVKPSGFWGYTARLVGDDPRRASRRFWNEATATLAAAVSLFGILYGVGKLMFHLPSETIAYPVAALVLGLAFIPYWWKQMNLEKD